MEKDPTPVVVAAVTLALGAFVVWVVRSFLADPWLLGLVVAGGAVGSAMVLTRSVMAGGVVWRVCAALIVGAGFVRAALSFEGRLEGGFGVMGGVLLGLSLTQFLTRRFEHPWMSRRKSDS